MNKTTITVGIAAVLSIFALTATAQAQNPDKPGRGQGRRMGQNRPGRNPGDRVSDRMMREASQRLQKAQHQMRQALPIYDGHRAKAIDLSELAQREIKIGLAWDRMKEQGGSPQPGNKSGGEPDGKRGPGHTDDQVKKSNAHLIAAGKLLEEALRLLSRAQADYGGHRRNAMEATTQAVQQLKEALQSV
jgi:hypothetical protein